MTFILDKSTQDKRQMAEETKNEAFVRLAEKRTNAVIKKIQILSNCSNPYAYEYDEHEIRSIFSAIEQELKKAKTKFDQNLRETEEFRLR